MTVFTARDILLWRTDAYTAIREQDMEVRPLCREYRIHAIRSLLILGLRIGSERYYADFMRFGLLDKTGIDLPGEAATIMHQPDKIGQVELATISFGQSFQLTPIELMTTVSSLINGGNRVTPHIGKEIH